MNLSTEHGDLKVKAIYGESTSVSTSSGNIQIGHVHGEALVQSETGNIVIDSLSGPLKVFTASGNIDAYVGQDGTAELHSQQGAVSVRVPSTMKAAVHLSGNSVSISSEIVSSYQETERTSADGKTTVTETQPILAFTFQGAQYTWTRLAQGYVDSPAVFSAAVQRTLAKMTDLPSTVCVLQYADDLIISSEMREDCEKASIIVCNVLAQAGFKASKEKLQWVQPKLNWTDEAEMHFAALKKAITTAPCLGLSNFQREFHLHVRETEGVAMGVLLQQHGSTYRPVSYLSKKLDNVAAGMPACLRAVSVAAIVVQMAEKIVLSHPMIVYTSHQACEGENFTRRGGAWGLGVESNKSRQVLANMACDPWLIH
ncbi:protein FAM185A [Labeo rohita]|uniref:ribonuclease H n=1 Tax=Labeo rohita TaxID=84645 RepID=A0A498P2C3_LABRO|nr:protein FAM185A [Labeo rohita]